MSKNKNNPLSLQKQTSFKKSGSPKKFVESISRKMCTELIKTYNTSIIDYFEKTLQASLIKEAKRCANDEKNDMTDGRKRKVLAQLILNKEDQKTNPRPKVDFVGGPFNITYHWSNNYKRAIYIFGEHHDEKVDCPLNTNSINIERFLSIHFVNSIAFTDFYLEEEAYVVPSGYQKRDISSYRISILRKFFNACIGPDRGKYRVCNNSRMHYFDIRQGEVKGGMNSASLFQSEIFLYDLEFNKLFENVKLNYFKTLQHEQLNDDEKFEKFLKTKVTKESIDLLISIHTCVKRWKSFFEFFARFDNENNTQLKLNYEKFWYGQIYNSRILKKEMDVMHSEVKPLLSIFIKQELDFVLFKKYKEILTSTVSKDVLREYEKINKFFSHYYNLSFIKDDLFYETYLLFTHEVVHNIIIFIYNSISQVLAFNCIITDAYLLARIFKTFKIDNPDIKQRPTDEPAEPHNIIIYAGNAHSQIYRKFLHYLGFREIETSGPLENPEPTRTNCVDMSSINQPLFSKWYNIKDEDKAEIFVDVTDKSFDSEFAFTKTIDTLIKEPDVPSDLLGFASQDRRRREPDFMIS